MASFDSRGADSLSPPGARSFNARVYEMVRRIPDGAVASYGGIAALLGAPRAARGVGWALAALPETNDVPWWRVVNRRGEISISTWPHAAQVQRRLLEEEGVRFGEDGRIDLTRFGWGGAPPVRASVSLAIRRGPSDEVLIVQRPADDDDLPNAWGLPAASLGPDESWEDAVRRAASGKLGIEVGVGRMLREGETARQGYTLRMRLYEARVLAGEPHVPQPDADVTQYQAWQWGAAADLLPAAEQGSLCSRLYLAHEKGSDSDWAQP